MTVVVLVIVLLIVPVLTAVVLSPVVLALFAAIHEKVEGILELNPKFNAVPLQTVVVFELVIDGTGLTIIVLV